MISAFNDTASCIFSLKVRSSGDIINRIKRKNEKRHPRQFTRTIQTTHQKHRHEANTCILHDKKQQRAEKKHKNKNIFHFSCKTLARFKLSIYLCNVKRKRPHRLTTKPFWRGGRVVDCTGLENRRTERYRGFESLPLRKKSGNNENCFLILFYTSGKLACRRSIKQNRLQKQSGVC